MDRRAEQLREAVAAYGVDLDTLARLAGTTTNVWGALRGAADAELGAVLQLLSALLNPLPGERFTTPHRVGAWLSLAMVDPQEQLWVLNLTQKTELISVTQLYRGTLSSANVRVAEVFREAILVGAGRVILAHNHPSGDPTPSAEDGVVTRRLVEAGQQLEITVDDHIVVGHGSWVSMREKRLVTFV